MNPAISLDGLGSRLYVRRAEAMQFLGVGKFRFSSLTRRQPDGAPALLRARRLTPNGRALFATADLRALRSRLADPDQPA